MYRTSAKPEDPVEITIKLTPVDIQEAVRDFAYTTQNIEIPSEFTRWSVSVNTETKTVEVTFHKG